MASSSGTWRTEKISQGEESVHLFHTEVISPLRFILLIRANHTVGLFNWLLSGQRQAFLTPLSMGFSLLHEARPIAY